MTVLNLVLCLFVLAYTPSLADERETSSGKTPIRNSNNFIVVRMYDSSPPQNPEYRDSFGYTSDRIYVVSYKSENNEQLIRKIPMKVKLFFYRRTYSQGDSTTHFGIYQACFISGVLYYLFAENNIMILASVDVTPGGAVSNYQQKQLPPSLAGSMHTYDNMSDLNGHTGLAIHEPGKSARVFDLATDRDLFSVPVSVTSGDDANVNNPSITNLTPPASAPLIPKFDSKVPALAVSRSPASFSWLFGFLVLVLGTLAAAGYFLRPRK